MIAASAKDRQHRVIRVAVLDDQKNVAVTARLVMERRSDPSTAQQLQAQAASPEQLGANEPVHCLLVPEDFQRAFAGRDNEIVAVLVQPAVHPPERLVLRPGRTETWHPRERGMPDFLRGRRADLFFMSDREKARQGRQLRPIIGLG